MDGSLEYLSHVHEEMVVQAVLEAAVHGGNLCNCCNQSVAAVLVLTLYLRPFLTAENYGKLV